MNLIFNRTENDLEYAKYLTNKIKINGFENLTLDEQTNWMNGLMGAYNFTDLNRVETETQNLYNLLIQKGYTPPDLTFKTDWNYYDLNGTDDNIQMTRFLNNIVILTQCFPSNIFPLPTNMNNLDIDSANNIEKAIFDMNSLLN